MNKHSSIKAWQLALPLGILCLVVVFYHGLYGNPSYIPPVIVNTPAPDFIAPELYTGEGQRALRGQRAPQEMRLSDYKGKVVVLNFWASWCRECALEHSSLLEINERYAKDDRFIMIGVNYQDKESLAQAYLEKHGNNFQHVRDFSGKVSIDYGIYGVPETFVIDKQGFIRHKSIGPILGETYTNLIEKIIEPLLKGETLKG